MTLADSPTTLKQRLNAALPAIESLLKFIGLGDFIRASKTTLFRKVPAVDSYNLSTVKVVKLPESAKASAILRAYARAGGVTGEMVVGAPNTTPSSGEVRITPSGDIATLGSDAITDLDVEYMPTKGKVVELTLPVVSNVLAIPSKLTTSPAGVHHLIEAESLVGTLTGKLIVLKPAAGAPATTKAQLDVAKANVQFAVADAVTSARVKFVCAPDFDLDAALEATSPF